MKTFILIALALTLSACGKKSEQGPCASEYVGTWANSQGSELTLTETCDATFGQDHYKYVVTDTHSINMIDSNGTIFACDSEAGPKTMYLDCNNKFTTLNGASWYRTEK